MMDAKRALTSKVFCPMPWTGLMFNFTGTVKNCIRSAGAIGDLKKDTIENILHGPVNRDTQTRMLEDLPGKDCYTCYDIENGKTNFDIASDRKFYIREFKHVPFDTYQIGNHDLQTIDVRWSNLCNFACVYCNPNFSSKWAGELKVERPKPDEQQIEAFKSYIFDRIKNLKHVYIAGGEPLLMKENVELLDRLARDNPDVNIRVNTNLSNTDTRLFDKISGFRNVHWIVSLESLEQEYEYIRYGGVWKEFLANLEIIKGLCHKISFNMLHFLLNYNSIFDCVEFLQNMGFHNNSFIIGPLLTPLYLNVRNLPDHVLQSLITNLESRISQKPGYLLEDSYRNMLHYIKQPFAKDLPGSFAGLQEMDQRRGLDSGMIFKDLYSLQQGNNHGKTI